MPDCHCPRCGFQWDPAGDPVERRLAAMRAACAREGWYVSPLDEVRADVAARLLGRQEKTLANWVATGDGPPSRRPGGRGPRMYALADLAAYAAAD